MPTLAQLQAKTHKAPVSSIRLSADEVLVPDDRGTVKPGQLVERKLTQLLIQMKRTQTIPR